jgi:putative Holliday junction resolvase
MKRLLGIDFGLKRCGLAITDDFNIISSGLMSIESKRLIDVLKQIILDKNIGVIVLGLPKRLNNEDSHITQNVIILSEVLKKEFSSVEIVLYDERFTSKMAVDALYMSGLKKIKRKDKSLIDEVSATIILQSYMQSKGM